MSLKEFEDAKKELGITISTTYKKIRSKYRTMILECHPDRSNMPKKEAEIKAARLNRAYAVIKDYCENFKMDFSEEEYYRQTPIERIKKAFANDPQWGNPKKDDE